MASPVGVPPGSRVSNTSYPSAFSRAASRLMWVDFPPPSGPSKEMNCPSLFMMSHELTKSIQYSEVSIQNRKRKERPPALNVPLFILTPEF